MPGRFLAVENGNLVVKVGVNIFFLISQRGVWKLVGRNLSPSDSTQSCEAEYTHANYFTRYKYLSYDQESSGNGAILRAITNQKEME